MRALVTGASGFVGRHLVRRLLQEDWTVVAFDCRPTEAAGIASAVAADILDRDALARAAKGADVVFHLAAAVGSAVTDPGEFRRVNVLGTEAVLDAAMAADVRRFVHVSSAGVYGAVPRDDIADEGYRTAPVTRYDVTKLEGERAALKGAAEGMDVTAARPGWAYGPGDRRTFKLIREIAAGRFMLVAKGRGRQTPVFVEDLVGGLLACAEKGRRGEVYNIAGSEILAVGDMAGTIARATGARERWRNLPRFPALAAAVLLEATFGLVRKEAPLNRGKLAFFLNSKPLSIDKARRELSWSPEVDFASGLRRTIAWYKAEGWL